MNIILLTIDCLRADHVGCLGYPRPTTSYIDRLAEGAGVVFRQAVANGPKTLASFPSILASVYPLWQRPTARLSVGSTTLAEALERAGYTTVAYHSNPYLSRQYGYDRGFHVFDDGLKDVSRVAIAGRRLRSFLPKNSPIYRVLRRVNRLMNVRSLAPPFVSGDVITGNGLKWLSRADGRLFLWLHYMDAHYPYVPPREYAEPFIGQYPRARDQARIFAAMLQEPEAMTTEEIELLVGLYDAQICRVDTCVGRIIDALWERGLQEQTVIAVTSDHGEEFREHGDFSHATSLHSRRSAKLHDELLRVPLIFYVPGSLGVDAPVVVNELVSLVDLSPTMLDLVGVEQPECWVGSSLVPLMKGYRGHREPVISGYWLDENEQGERIEPKPIVCCRTSEWKYIYDGQRKQRLLFHLPTDPGEKQDLYTEQPVQATHFEEIIREHLTEAEHTSQPGDAVEHDEAVLQRLRGLGYIDQES